MRRTTSILLTFSFILLLSLLLSVVQPAQAAPGTYIPVTVTQPDGTELNLFASGDEYYNWLHDANGYTIMQDPDTGYYVYADLVDGELVPTALLPEQDDPAAAGLVPQLNISAERREALRREFLALAPESISTTPKTGTITNLVIFICFAAPDPCFPISSQDPSRELTSKYTDLLNTGTSSLKSYFFEASYNALTINSQLFPTPGTTILVYQDSHLRSYFQPYSAANTNGYTGGDNGTDRRTREHTLLKNAVTYINGLNQFPSAATIDADNDGRVDDVTFIISGTPTAWSTLLWPHRWSLYTTPYAYIRGKQVYDYSFQIQSDTNVGVLVHETFHVVGAPDLYRYYDDTIDPVGVWDIMNTVYRNVPPQHMGCYMKWKYGNWISSIPELSTSGTYSLNPMGPSGECYKVASPNSSSEFYILEYRRDAGTYESTLPASGLLVYRINSNVEGNADGPPDEVYVYRPGGTNPTANGTVNQAYYSAEAGRTTINDSTSPSPFLSDGSPGGLAVDSVSSAGATISFHLGGATGIGYLISGNAGTPGATLSYYSGGSRTATANGSGDYSFTVPEHWTGTVTPSKLNFAFTPDHRDYADVTTDRAVQDYAASIALQTPTIGHVYPANGATNICLKPQVGVDLLLAALVRDANGSFDPTTVTLKLDDVVHTTQARITQSAIQPSTHALILYTPPGNLSAALHHAAFTYPSTDGPVTYDWYFTVSNTACGTSAPVEAAAPAPHADAPSAEEPSEASADALESAGAEIVEESIAAPETSEGGIAATLAATVTPLVTPGAWQGLPHPGLFRMMLGTAH